MANLDFLYRNCDEYILLSKELDVILNTPKLSKKAFNTIIDDNTLDKLSIGDILVKYENFTEQQLNEIKRYIHSHLHDKNPLFISDLIDCANNNSIESDIIFDFCMDTIKGTSINWYSMKLKWKLKGKLNKTKHFATMLHTYLLSILTPFFTPSFTTFLKVY